MGRKKSVGKRPNPHLAARLFGSGLRRQAGQMRAARGQVEPGAAAEVRPPSGHFGRRHRRVGGRAAALQELLRQRRRRQRPRLRRRRAPVAGAREPSARTCCSRTCGCRCEQVTETIAAGAEPRLRDSAEREPERDRHAPAPVSRWRRAASERAPIDHFFRTLARPHDGHAIGVILTGTGSRRHARHQGDQGGGRAHGRAGSERSRVRRHAAERDRDRRSSTSCCRSRASRRRAALRAHRAAAAGRCRRRTRLPPDDARSSCSKVFVAGPRPHRPRLHALQALDDHAADRAPHAAALDRGARALPASVLRADAGRGRARSPTTC